jgi:hypothetical protein
MAEPRPPDLVCLVIALFSRHPEALAWASDRLEGLYGPVALASTEYEFLHTAYYEPTMGPHLRKRFLAFHDLVSPESLPEIKLQTNSLERELAAAGGYVEPRPLNLDPGLLSLGKFLLATTKDQAHRIYLRKGILAEVTLRFEAGSFEPWPWTYADYRESQVRAFLKEARGLLRTRLRATRNKRNHATPHDSPENH